MGIGLQMCNIWEIDPYELMSEKEVEEMGKFICVGISIVFDGINRHAPYFNVFRSETQCL